MSAISELIRDSPVYKKAVLAAAVTAGVGACVYFGYRCASGGKGPVPRSFKPEKKTAPHKDEPSVEREEQLLPKKRLEDIDLVKTVPTSKVESIRQTSSLQKTDELSTSGTFEKISLATNESDNFEHLSMSQVQATQVSPTPETKAEKLEDDISSSTISFIQAEGEGNGSMSIINPSDVFENLSMSQAGLSVSYILPTSGQCEEVGASGDRELSSSVSITSRGAEADNDDDSDLIMTKSGIKLKDENDIVVVEQTPEDSNSEKVDEQRALFSGTASTDAEFDASCVSPVFGNRNYHRISTESAELDIFDPSKSHPASFGFKFNSNI